MGTVQDLVDRLRYAFQRDKERGGDLLAKGNTNLVYAPDGYNMLQAYGFDALSEHLRLEHDLMMRYVDYEEMQQHPLIAGALDLFADDASQPDTHIKRTVWVTSQDKVLQNHLDDVFHKRLRMDEEVWEIGRSLCLYGDNYEELLITKDGVVGLNHLPPPTVRRVEGPRNELYGFIQDFRGRFNYSPQEFQQILAQRNEAIARLGAGRPAVEEDTRVTGFEPWEVVHFRLRGKYRRSLHGHCIAGDSVVWTSSGCRRIDELQSGDVVYTRHAGKLRTTRVLDQTCSGKKPVLRLKTVHREIRLTTDHKVLLDRGGKNKWVKAGSLKCGDRLVAAASMPEALPPPVLGLALLEIAPAARVRLTERGAEALRTRSRFNKYVSCNSGLGPVARQLGLTRKMLADLLAGESSFALATVSEIFAKCGVPLFEGAVEVVRDSRLALPDFVDEKFARLFGFLLGDGWLTEKQVFFARGVREERNNYYVELLASLGLPVSTTPDGAQSYVSCQALVAVFSRLGWNGEKAHDKRVPEWLFAQSRSLRIAFLDGFMDADGWTTEACGSKYEYTELCNEALVRDLKALVDGLGFTCGNVRRREAREGKKPVNGRPINSGPTFTIGFRRNAIADSDFTYEVVKSITPDGEDFVYDIEVADTSHNFIANGLVVHNSILEGARWLYKRLILLEDAVLVHRLQRAPERFAFYVDVGDLPPAEALAYLNRVRQQHKKKKFVNPSTNKFDLRFNAASVDEDFYVPVRKGVEGTRIETIGGPVYNAVDDIEYFQKQIFAALKVPRAYLGQEESASKGTLSQVDVQFARSVLRVQRELRNGFKKIARTHLAALNVDPLRVDFEVNMTVPSSIFELAQLEVRNARADLAGRMREHVSLHWVLENVYGLSEEDIMVVIKERSEDVIREGKATAEVEKASAMAQASVQQQMAPPEAPPEAPESVQRRGPRLAYSRQAARPITEKELFRHSNKEAEKRALDKLETLLQNDRKTARKVSEIGGLLRDIRSAVGK